MTTNNSTSFLFDNILSYNVSIGWFTKNSESWLCKYQMLQKTLSMLLIQLAMYATGNEVVAFSGLQDSKIDLWIGMILNLM